MLESCLSCLVAIGLGFLKTGMKLGVGVTDLLYYLKDFSNKSN